jgi:hypothetical protein
MISREKTCAGKVDVGAALRAAGFVPTPRLWVTKDDLDLIMWMARKHGPRVNEIRAAAKAGNKGGPN